jgi:hypothetical protein
MCLKEKLKVLINTLRINDSQANRLLTVNSICGSIIKYMEQRLDQKLNNEQYRGLIFCCDKSLFPRYDKDFREILKVIGYLSVGQSVPESEKIHEFLKVRLKEHLAKEIEQSINGRLKASVSAGVISAEGDLGKNIKSVLERAETLVGLLESYLRLLTDPVSFQNIKSKFMLAPNLMIIINNAEEFNIQDFKTTIDAIFAAATTSNQRSALTLVYSFPFHHNDSWQPGNWFVFIPQEMVKDSIDFVWTRLKPNQQNLLNRETIKTLLHESKGSTGILHEKSNVLWEESSLKEDHDLQ